MKVIMALPLSLLFAVASSHAQVQPGQCGPGFDLWDLNCDGKINYEESLASGQAYRDEVARVHQPVARERLRPPSEVGYPRSAVQTTGHWVQTDQFTVKAVDAGPYSQLLTPNSVGQACLKGTKGLLMATERTCKRWNTGGWMCWEYSDPVAVATYGYKAECR